MLPRNHIKGAVIAGLPKSVFFEYGYSAGVSDLNVPHGHADPDELVKPHNHPLLP
jgi:hypothetical protein